MLQHNNWVSGLARYSAFTMPISMEFHRYCYRAVFQRARRGWRLRGVTRIRMTSMEFSPGKMRFRADHNCIQTTIASDKTHPRARFGAERDRKRSESVGARGNGIHRGEAAGKKCPKAKHLGQNSSSCGRGWKFLHARFFDECAGGDEPRIGMLPKKEIRLCFGSSEPDLNSFW